jgi:DNA ligase D-like protein (predicted ligase)
MLAEMAMEPFDSADHLFEIKWDGTRCIAFVEHGNLRLQNRRYVEMRGRYPEFAAGLSRLPPGTVLDAEIVVLEGGKPSFSKLAQRDHVHDPQRVAMISQRLPATMMVFDLLYRAGKAVMDRPLRERREQLGDLLKGLKEPHIVAADFIEQHGVKYFEAVRQVGLEGIMAKRADSPYLPGKRTSHWMKIKVARIEVFDVLGFVRREKQPFVSALLLGVHDGKRWIYKGNVGSGFTETQRGEWYHQLSPLEPLADPPKDGPKNASWRKTGVRCRVRFFEETADGKLRGPVFEGFAG